MYPRQAVIEKFDRWAPYYDESTLQPLYQAAHRAVLAEAVRCAPRPRRILDVGCGTGLLVNEVVATFAGAVGVGVDLSAGMLAVAAGRCGPRRGGFVHAAVEELPFRSGVFDLVISTISLDHWCDRRAGLGESVRVLDADGLLAVAVAGRLFRARYRMLRQREEDRCDRDGPSPARRERRRFCGSGVRSLARHRARVREEGCLIALTDGRVPEHNGQSLQMSQRMA